MLEKVEFNYTPSGVCSKILKIILKHDPETPKTDAIIEDVKFYGGCPGNALGLAAAIKGRKITEVASMLKGIECGIKGTSCPDQTSKALEEWLSK